MESPKRKLQKQNDYQRHKLFRKIKRRRKALAELDLLIAEKLLKKKLKLPKYDTGTDDVVYVDRNKLGVDEEGNILKRGNIVGDGTLRLQDVDVKPRNPFDIDVAERNAEMRQLRSEMGDAAYEEYMDRLKTLRDIRSASVPQDLSIYGYAADAIDGIMTGVSMLPGPISLAGDEYWGLRGAKQLSEGDPWGVLGVAPIIGKSLPEAAILAKSAYNSISDYSKMFDKWADKRRIASAINQGVLSWDGTTPMLYFKSPTNLQRHHIWTEGDYAKLNIDPYADVNLASNDVSLGYADIVNQALENTRVIDKNGNLNIKALQHLKEQVELHYGQNYNLLISQKVGRDPINIHSKAVFDTAKSSPTPLGFTRLQYLEAALLHDIGKLSGDYSHHAKAGVDLLKQLHYPADLDVLNSIQNHMHGGQMLDLDPLTRGVHFADVARGLEYQDAAFRFPQLLYPRPLPLQKPVVATTRDLIKNYINPILKREGYDTIPLDVSDEEAQALVDLVISLHRSFLRGVRDPAKTSAAANGINVRNARNARQGAIDAFGVDSPQTRLDYSLQYVPSLPTGSGRSDLFQLKRKGHSDMEHQSSVFSRNMGIDPNTKDGVYVSTSDEILNNYATASDARETERAIVQLPRVGESGDSSLAEQIGKNDWELYPSERVRNGIPPEGVYAMYEKPYRLLTGRSLQLDLIAEDPNVPKLEYNSLREYPVLEEGDINIARPFGSKYSTTPTFQDIKDINKAFERSGSNVRIYIKGLTEDEYGTIGRTATIPDLGSYEKLVDTLNEYYRSAETFDKEYLNYKKVYLDLKDCKIEVGKDINDITNELHEKGFTIDTYPDPFSNDYITNIIDKNGEDVAYGVNGKITVIKNNLTIPHNYFSEKQARIFMHNILKGNFEYADKFIPDESSVIKKAAKTYVNDLKRKKHAPTTKSLMERAKYLKNPRRLDDFVRSKGVVPRYDLESFNSSIVGAADQLYPAKNSTKNADIREHKLFVVGDKGKKVLEKRKEITGSERVSKHRDAGIHTKKYNVTRKSAQ